MPRAMGGCLRECVHPVRPPRRDARRLGSGAYGTVYDTCDGAALKVVPLAPGVAGDTLREVCYTSMFAAGLSPYNVVTSIGVCPSRCEAYIRMLLAPSTLASLTYGAPVPSRLPPSFARRIMRDVLTQLATLHALGICHGDVKPENILILAGGDATLVDFGTSLLLRDGKTVLRRDMICTEAWRPPELGDPNCISVSGALLDLWAVGAALVVAHTSTIPFVAPSVSSTGGGAGAGARASEVAWTGHQVHCAYVRALLHVQVEGGGDSGPSPSPSPSPTSERVVALWPELALVPGAPELAASLLSLDPGRRPSALEVLSTSYFTHDYSTCPDLT